MKIGKVIAALALVAASALPAAAESISDVELAKQLQSQLKCDSNKSPNCSLTFRGLEIEFTDIKNPAGGAMAVIYMGPTQKYTNYGARCMMIEFTDKDLLPPAAKKTGIVFRSDGTIMPSSETKEADAACY